MMEENQRRNQLREARVKLEKTRKNLNRVARVQENMRRAKTNLNEIEQQEQLAQNNRLNYGIRFWSTYRGHDRQEVNGIIWNHNSR